MPRASSIPSRSFLDRKRPRARRPGARAPPAGGRSPARARRPDRSGRGRCRGHRAYRLGVFLTEKGHALADRVRVRHRLVVDLLRALGVPTEAAEADAEGIEHHVSEITLKAFAQFLKVRG